MRTYISQIVRWSLGVYALLLIGAATATSDTGRLRIHIEDDGGTNVLIQLRGADARQQVLVTRYLGTAAEVDLTRNVEWETSPDNVIRVNRAGVITPLADGEAVLVAKATNGVWASAKVRVEGFKAVRPINFANQIVPIFTKTGCNGGGCHGKSGGQNGFRLSLLGFEPQEDYEHLVKEARGRRLFPAAPQKSLLLLKATAESPHGGGKRIEIGSEDYKLITRWIEQGVPYGRTNDPVLSHIEVFPRQRTLGMGGEQQLIVMAHYSDGSREDVTRSALFEPNDKDMAHVSETGHVQFFRQPGDVGIMVRYQAKVAVFRGTIPLGAPVEKLPLARNFIDELVFSKLKAIGMPPSEPADDATFIRRAALDIAGRLPTPQETREFLASKDPSRREQWIDNLLNSGGYADNFANKWSALLRNKRTDSTHKRGTYAFHNWIRDSFFENKPYDQFVRELLSASGDMFHSPPVAWYRQVRETTAQLEDTAQLFLGQRLQCAQCHHHPFEKWSQQDYYSFAAFFGQIGRKPGSQPGEEMIYVKRTAATATNKKTKQPVKAAGLGSAPQDVPADQDARLVLASWMTAKENRFFARSLVNRYWKHFFNRALVDPEDDMRETNPPSNPELLDALAKHFVDSGYDLKKLVRAICTSQTYQLSSMPNQHNAVDKQNYSRYYPRRLSAETLLDAVNAVTRSESKFDGLPSGTRALQLPDNSFNTSSYFLTVFGRPDSATSCECERSADASLSQSLHLLNSKDVQEKISNEKGAAASLAADTKTADPHKLRELYLAAYSRPITEQELSIAQAHLEKFAKAKDEKIAATGRREAYEDIIWALINTKEFLFNH